MTGRRRAETWFLAGMAVAVTVLLVTEALRLSRSLDALTFPATIGAIVVAACILALIRDRRRPAATASNPADAGLAWSGPGWVAVSLLCATGLGYPIGLAVFVLGYGLAHRQGPRSSLAAALVVLVAVGVGFVWLLGVPLPVTPVMLR